MIGEVAEKTGVTTRTLRYYEELELIKPEDQNERGFRVYSVHAIARLQFIKQLKMLDFSLEEIQKIIKKIDSVKTGAELSGIMKPVLDRQKNKTCQKISCYEQMKEDITKYFEQINTKK